MKMTVPVMNRVISSCRRERAGDKNEDVMCLGTCLALISTERSIARSTLDSIIRSMRWIEKLNNTSQTDETVQHMIQHFLQRKG